MDRPPKWIEPDAVAGWREGLRRGGRRLVVTNGCFDILHAGHVRYLREARAMGDALLVLLNGDASVRELKGPGRPVNGVMDRAEVLGALEAVDAVSVFEGARCDALLRLAAPEVYVKGGDYTLETLDAAERAALDAVGAQVRIVGLVPGRSTTLVLERTQAGGAP